jgi:hypothetical protein
MHDSKEWNYGDTWLLLQSSFASPLGNFASYKVFSTSVLTHQNSVLPHCEYLNANGWNALAHHLEQALSSSLAHNTFDPCMVTSIQVYLGTRHLKGPLCRLERGWISATTKLNSFFPNTWADSAPPVRPVVVTGQTGQTVDFTGDTGQTGAPHRSGQCSIEHLQKQLQAPLNF